MFVVGVLDDRFQLSPLAKLVVVAHHRRLPGVLADAAAGQRRCRGRTRWSRRSGLRASATRFNLLDNMDGLAGGVALIAAAFLAWLPGRAARCAASSLLLVALCGALLGFLYWNRPPARLFMGDCGSLFIGAVIAGASLMPVLQERTRVPVDVGARRA